MKADPELAARMAAVSIATLAEVNARRRTCVCGLVSKPSGIGLHQKASGHTGWSE